MSFDPSQPIAGAGKNARSVLAAAYDWLLEHGSVVLATLVACRGSSPVPVGGQMVIGPGQQIAGSVSGGCVELDVVVEAEDVRRTGVPKLVTFGSPEAVACGLGLPCGGAIEIFIERLAGREDVEFLDAILAAERERRALVSLTHIDSGERRLYAPGPAMQESGIIDAGDRRAFLKVHAPPIRLVIVGATHIAQVLSEMAVAAGMQVMVVDPRPAFANASRFSVPFMADWPDTLIDAATIDTRTAVVTLTHAEHIDDIALRCALQTSAGYIGALGSRETHARRLARLSAGGIGAQELERVRGPVGLDIGAVGPAEIAVSILAGLVADSRRGAREQTPLARARMMEHVAASS